jgi:hypothetical protein
MISLSLIGWWFAISCLFRKERTNLIGIQNLWRQKKTDSYCFSFIEAILSVIGGIIGLF